MKEGIYSAQFRTPHGSGSGVIVVAGNSFRGGDANFYYVGDFSKSEGVITANLTVKRHQLGGQSVFGVDPVKLSVSGKAKEDSADLSGSFSGVNFSVHLQHIPGS